MTDSPDWADEKARWISGKHAAGAAWLGTMAQALRDEREACVARISDLYFKSDPPSLNIVAVIEAIRNQP